MGSAKKDLKEILREAEQQGWRVVKGSKHHKLYAPDGKNIVTASATPGGPGAIANILADLRRYGFRWKGR